MKRVLVLNGNSYVGAHIAAAFYDTGEYDVAVTLSARDDGDNNSNSNNNKKSTTTACAATRLDALPAALRRCVTSIVPRHDVDADAFARGLRQSDVIVAVVRDDVYEAARACRVLRGARDDTGNGEVERTFVLVSSLLAWSDTQHVARAQARRAARAQARAAYRDDNDNDDESPPLPAHLREEHDDDDDDDDVDGDATDVLPVLTEAAYKQRCPHPRYAHWRRVEQAVKQSNTATLHTTVVVAGLAYGDGGDDGGGGGGDGGLLHTLLRRAWHAQTLPQYGVGDNVLPLIHVRDLAALVLRVGDAYDMPTERYLVAVDRATTTQRELLYAIAHSLGGRVVRVDTHDASPHGDMHTTDAAAAAASSVSASSTRLRTLQRLRARYGNEPYADMGFFLSHIRAQPDAVLSLLPEDAWVALGGFVRHIDRVVYEFRRAQPLPLRVLVTGPPCSGHAAVARALATLRGLPCVSASGALVSYTRHVAALRRELHALLLRRLLRRRAQRRLRVLQQQREARLRGDVADAQRGSHTADDGDDDDANNNNNNDDGNDANDDDDDDADDTSSHDDNNDDNSDDDDDAGEAAEQRRREAMLRDVLLACALDDTPDDVAAAARRITERYICGPRADNDNNNNDNDDDNDDDDDDDVDDDASDVDEEMEESDDDDASDDDDDDDDVDDVDAVLARRAARRARAAAAARDADERIRIRVLRDEYTLARRVMSRQHTHETARRRRRADEYDDAAAEEHSDTHANDDDDKAEEQKQQQQQMQVNNDNDNNDDADRSDSDVDKTNDNGNVDKTNNNDNKNNSDDVDVSHYSDEALAFCVRWRLRQPDCRNRGYVLHSFPATVRQARLLFRAATTTTTTTTSEHDKDNDENDDDDDDDAAVASSSSKAAARLLRAHARLPRHVDDVPPPYDADFTLLLSSSPSSRRQQQQHLRTRSSAIDTTTAAAAAAAAYEDEDDDDDNEDNEDGDDDEVVMAAVDEAFFPHHVLVLECDDHTLRHCAAAAAAACAQTHDADSNTITAQRTAGSSSSSSSSSSSMSLSQFVRVAHHRTPHSTATRRQTLPVDDDDTAMARARTTVTPTPRHDDNNSNNSNDDSHRQDRRKSSHDSSQASQVTAAVATPAQHAQSPQRLPHACACELARFDDGLRRYRAHHRRDGASSPSSSVLLWLLTVQTTAVCGATAEPVRLRCIDNDEDKNENKNDDADGDDKRVQLLSPPSTTRTATLTFVQLDTPFASCVQPATTATATTTTATRAACVVDGAAAAAVAAAYAASKLPRCTPSYDESVTTTVNVAEAAQPRSDEASDDNNNDGVAATTARDARDVADAVTAEHATLQRLRATEQQLRAQLEQATTHAVLEERCALRALQLAESCVRAPTPQTHKQAARHGCRADDDSDNAAAAAAALPAAAFPAAATAVDDDMVQQLPMEAYLMTYVLPTLTPAIARVTRLRPRNAVMALADMLYTDKRRTTL